MAGGEPKAAEELIRQALETIDAAGRKEAGWRGWVLAALAHRRTGDAEHARVAIERGAARLAELRRLWTATDFDHYVQRPDISGLLKVLNR
jgi:hypothetical protein